jgi:hypothetical protein
MRIHAVRRLTAVGGFLLSGSLAAVQAQKTGTLNTDSLASRRASPQALAEAANLAVLLYDPSFASPMRSSAYGLDFVLVDSLQEGRIQLNVCDLPAIQCDSTSVLVMLAGPLNNKKLADLVNLDGLIGDARVEIAATYNLVRRSELKATVSAVVAYPEFAFRSSPSLAEDTVKGVTYRILPGLGWRGSSWSVFAGYSYERIFAEQEQQTVCTPASFGPAGTTVCSEIVVGAPTEIKANSLRFEGKLVVARFFAFGASWKHDFTNDKDALDIPLYFLSTTTQGVAGGARVGFRTGKNTPSLTFFVNAFKL